MKKHGWIGWFGVIFLVCGLPVGMAASVDVAGIEVPLRMARDNRTNQVIFAVNKSPRTISVKNVPAGRYRLMAEVRFADKSSEDKTTMLGRYNFVLPKSSYTFEIDGKSVAMVISPRDPKNVGQDAEKNPIFTGWLYSEDVLTIVPMKSITVSCRKKGAFIQTVMLLDESAWQVEQLRASDRLTIQRAGFGVAWQTQLWRPKQVYAVKTLDRVCQSMEAFQKSEFIKNIGGKIAFQPLIDQGRTLKQDIEAYKKLPVNNDRDFIDQGRMLVDRWKELFKAIDTEMAKIIPSIDDLVSATLTDSKAKANEQCSAGRETLFNAAIAEKYLVGVKDELKQIGQAEDIYKKHEILTLTFAQNAAEYALKAKAFSEKPQTTVVFKEYEITSPETNTVIEPLISRESICLNGRWNFAVAENADTLPKSWTIRQVPDETPTFSYNWDNISDDQWVRDTRAYWKSSAIQKGWFRTDFTVPAGWNGNEIVIRFEEIMLYGEIFVNGQYCGNHCGGLIPFEIDVTKFVVPGKTNHLLIFVESNQKTAHRGSKVLKNCSMSNLYPVADQHAYHMGIRGDVCLIARPKVHIDDVYVQTSFEKKKITIQTTLVNTDGAKKKITLVQRIRKDGDNVLELSSETLELKPGERKIISVSQTWSNPLLWGIGGDYGDPANRYFLESCICEDEKQLDRQCIEFGFREMTIRGSKFYLNGKEIPIQGDSDMMGERDRNKQNRWEFAQLARIRRQANINMLRLSRCQFVRSFFEVANWTGLLLEAEGPWWGLYSPDNCIGELCYDDPVWLANCEDYYRTIVRTYRNEPSFVFWSSENETLRADTVETILKFNKWSREEAPHIVMSEHGAAGCWDDRFPVCDFHDYDMGVERMKEWVRESGAEHKPMVVGEFWNYFVYRIMGSMNPVEAKGAERMMAKWLMRSIQSYRAAGASGIMPYTFLLTGSLMSMGSPETMGPWADLILKRMKETENKEAFAVVYIPWPSLAGPGGWRVEKTVFGASAESSNINFFDPTRPVCTPTKVFTAWQQAFHTMPIPEFISPPELIVQVVNNGKAVGGINVFIQPKTGESLLPTGIKADENGKAWFILREPGTYTVNIDNDGKTIQNDVTLSTTILGDQAGFDYITQMIIDVASGDVKIIPGKTAIASTKKTTKVDSDKNVKTLPTAMADAIDAKNGPAISDEGFIRSWLLYGPFPNYGGRTKQENGAWYEDLLKKYGSESSITPAPGEHETVEFKEDDQSFWETGKIEIAWRPFTSKTDVIPLNIAFSRTDLPGLEGSLQYVMGYAACWVESDREQKAVVTLGSDDGYKLWINHELVAEKRIFRECKKDEDRHAVNLKKGWNLVLLKIEQDIGGYEFAMRFLTPDGKPLKLNVRNTPPTDAKTNSAAMLTMNEWIKDWLVCGPFPNVGGRPTCKGFDTDFFKAEGGEANLKVREGKTYSVDFPADDDAYWNEGQLTVGWKKYTSADETINLGKALVMPGVEGLDIEPVQYVVGYAAKTFILPEATNATLELRTYNGVKVWLNGKVILSEHKHTYNRDPASQVLPSSAESVYKIPVDLSAGENHLLIKVDVDYGPLGFKMRLIN